MTTAEEFNVMPVGALVPTFSNGIRVVNATPHELVFRDGDTDIIVPPFPGVTLPAEAVEEEIGVVPAPNFDELRLRHQMDDEAWLNEFAIDEARTLGRGAVLVRATFAPTDAGLQQLALLRRVLPGVLIVASIISAQAYAARDVVSMVPVLGLERVPPAEKRMRTDRFTTFAS